MARILPAGPTIVARVITPRTFTQLIAERLRTDPGQPLVTAYDDATGERTELSVTTYVNWVSKTANLFTEELGLEPGDTVLIELPAHWLVPVFLGAAWSAGISVTTGRQVRHDLVICGPDTMHEHENGDADQVVACSLLPFAVRFPEPLQGGLLDYGLLWPGQSDVFIGLGQPSPDTVAWLTEDRSLTQAELLETAVGTAHDDSVRLITDVHPLAGHGVPAFLAPLAHGGSLVLLSKATEDTWAARQRDERATDVLRDYPPTE